MHSSATTIPFGLSCHFGGSSGPSTETQIQRGRESVHGLEPKRTLADHETRDHTRVDTGRFADAVFERLELTAIKRRSNVSAIAAEILDRNLPRLRIEQEV
jgi:hypothetical protein